MEQMKKKTIKIIIGVLVVALMAGGGIYYYMNNQEEEVTVEANEDTTEDAVITYGESSNPTSLLKTIYEDLIEAHENQSDDEAELAAAYFTVDFFTWSNKTEREDIGGINMVLSSVRTDFASFALRDYYINFAEFAEEYGTSNLPEVIDYEIEEVEESEFVMEDETYADYPCTDVTISFSYLKGTNRMDTSTMKTEAKITMILVDDLYYVVGVDYENA